MKEIVFLFDIHNIKAHNKNNQIKLISIMKNKQQSARKPDVNISRRSSLKAKSFVFSKDAFFHNINNPVCRFAFIV